MLGQHVEAEAVDQEDADSWCARQDDTRIGSRGRGGIHRSEGGGQHVGEREPAPVGDRIRPRCRHRSARRQAATAVRGLPGRLTSSQAAPTRAMAPDSANVAG